MSCNGDCGSCGTRCDYVSQVERDIYKMMAFKSDIRKEYDSLKKPTNAVVSLTNQCNNACPYCFVDFNPMRMGFETAEKIIAFLKENCSDGEIPTFVFFGGEPLLEFEGIIKPLIEKYGESVKWSITTNGTLLTEEIIDFFSDNKVSILLSMDGNKQIQDKQRPLKNGNSSFEAIMKNFNYLILRNPEICVRSTITKDSIEDIFDFMLFLEKNNVRHCTFCVNENEEYTENDYLALRKQIDKCGKYMYEKLMKGEKVICFDGIISAYHELCEMEKIPMFHNGLNRCGMGTTSIGISPDGTFHPCQEENSTTDYVIGNINDGIDKEAHIRYLQSYFDIMSNLHCEEPCPINMKLYCFNQQCPNQILHRNGKISTAKCAYLKTMKFVAAKFVLLLRNNIRPDIRSFMQEEGF